MSFFERLHRLYEVKVFGKKYCSMTSRHGHEMEYDNERGGEGLYRWSLWKCSVCNERFVLDAVGFCKYKG